MNSVITVYVVVMLGMGDTGLVDVNAGQVHPTKQQCQAAVAEYVRDQEAAIKRDNLNIAPVVPVCAAKQVPTNGLRLE